MIIQKSLFVYSLILLLSIFGGGSIVRLYGDTCGISLLDPSSWGSSFILMGSPWCRGLNWLGYVSTTVVENIWYHTIANIVGYMLLHLPSTIGENVSSKMCTDNSRNMERGKLDFKVD